MDLSKALGKRGQVKIHTLEHYLTNRIGVARADKIAASKLLVNNYLIINSAANPSSQSLTIDTLYSENIKQGLNHPIMGLATYERIKELVDNAVADLEVKPVTYNSQRYYEAVIQYLYVSRDIYSLNKKMISCFNRKYDRDGFGYQLAWAFNNHQTHTMGGGSYATGWIEQFSLIPDDKNEVIDGTDNITASFNVSNNKWKTHNTCLDRVLLPVNYMNYLDGLFGLVYFDEENSRQPSFLQFWPTACTLTWGFDATTGDIDFNDQQMYYLGGFGEGAEDNQNSFERFSEYCTNLNSYLGILRKNFPAIPEVLAQLGCVTPDLARFERSRTSKDLASQIVPLKEADSLIKNVSHTNYNESIITHDTIDEQVAFETHRIIKPTDIFNQSNYSTTVGSFEALLRGAVVPMDYAAYIYAQEENATTVNGYVQYGPIIMVEPQATVADATFLTRMMNINRVQMTFGTLVPNGFTQGSSQANGSYIIRNEVVTPAMSDLYLGVGNAYCYKIDAADEAFNLTFAKEDKSEDSKEGK